MASIAKAFHKPLGSITLAKPITDRLGVREIVDKYVPMERNRRDGLTHGQVIEALVANRLSAPRPLYKVEDWAQDFAVGESYGIPPEKLNDDRVGRALDAIYPYLEELKSELAMQALTEFDLRKDQVIYDLTSLYFEGEYEASELVTYGYSSTGDGDKKQVTLGLNVSPEGVPLYHRVMEGNRVDKVTVAENMRALRKVLMTSSFLMIGDRGVMTKRNIARMQAKGVSYLGSYQLDSEAKELVKGIPEEEFRLLGYRSRKGGRYYGVERVLGFQHEGKEYSTRVIVVKSEEKAEKDRERRQKALGKLREGLEHIREKLNQRKYKRREYVKGRLEKLFSGRMRRYKKLLEVKLEGEDGRLELEYSLKKDAVQEEAKLDGKYLLVTDQELSMEEALRTYKSRNLVEVRVRNFKQTVRVRPLFLQSDERIASLVFVNVLALMVYSILELLARRGGMEVTGRRLLEGFQGLSVIFLQMEDGTREVLTEELTPWQGEVVERLGLPSPKRMIQVGSGSEGDGFDGQRASTQGGAE
jgi:transposase